MTTDARKRIRVSRGKAGFYIKTPGPWAKNLVATIAGASWKSSPFFVWAIPASPTSVGALVANCEEIGFDIMLNPSCAEEFRQLVDQLQQRNDAQKYKIADELSPPPVCNPEPKHWLHQLRGYHFYNALEAGMIPFDMGTGKTKLAIDLIQNVNDGEPFRALIVCPRYVVRIWPKEVAKHCALDTAVCHPESPTPIAKRIEQLQRAERLAGLNSQSFLAVVNYEVVLNDQMKAWLTGTKWDVIILDESHRIKSPSGEISRFIRTKLRKAGRRRYCLTGTPAPHSPLDVWSQYYFLDPDIYGAIFGKFKYTYATLEPEYYHPIEWINQDKMAERFFSIAYRVTAEEVLDLPEKKNVDLTCTLEPSAMKIYKDLKKNMIAEIEQGTITAANAPVKLLRLLQLTGGFLPTDESNYEKSVRVSTAKADLFGELLDDLGPHEPLVVFAVFHNDLDAIRQMAESKGRTVSEISGRSKAGEVDQWIDGKTDILAAQIKSGSLGIDLTRARYAVYYSPGYSAGDFNQSERRIWRPGQEKAVTYYRLIVEHTSDADAYKTLEGKLSIVEAMLGSEAASMLKKT